VKRRHSIHTVWLLEADYERQKIGEHARERIFRDHTYHSRAEVVIKTLNAETHSFTQGLRIPIKNVNKSAMDSV